MGFGRRGAGGGNGSMVQLVRHRQTKRRVTDRLHLNDRATSRLYSPFPFPVPLKKRLGKVVDGYEILPISRLFAERRRDTKGPLYICYYAER